MEKTFVMIKPDGVLRGLIGEIVKRFELKGFKVSGLKLMRITEELAAKHYEEHVGKPFYPGLVQYITGGPVVAMVLEGKNVISEIRKMNGATNPIEAQAGTIRGDFAQDIGRNVVHASDSNKSAEREINIYFTKEELCAYEHLAKDWLYE